MLLELNSFRKCFVSLIKCVFFFLNIEQYKIVLITGYLVFEKYNLNSKFLFVFLMIISSYCASWFRVSFDSSGVYFSTASICSWVVEYDCFVEKELKCASTLLFLPSY